MRVGERRFGERLVLLAPLADTDKRAAVRILRVFKEFREAKNRRPIASLRSAIQSGDFRGASKWLADQSAIYKKYDGGGVGPTARCHVVGVQFSEPRFTGRVYRGVCNGGGVLSAALTGGAFRGGSLLSLFHLQGLTSLLILF